ncbi:hypothetical protein [Archaeoglobus neptunius]|uniref:hypothetical protein n=1 Tax=Archaeoglobus neptunius TaxID=2798580 RepID=UPI0019253FE4|nr:hypothetical protein [Archaeoglobus neptunius]
MKKGKRIKLVLEVQAKDDVGILEIGMAIGGMIKDLESMAYRYAAYYEIENKNSCRFSIEDLEEDEDGEEEEGAIPPNSHFKSLRDVI